MMSKRSKAWAESAWAIVEKNPKAEQSKLAVVRTHQHQTRGGGRAANDERRNNTGSSWENSCI